MAYMYGKCWNWMGPDGSTNVGSPVENSSQLTEREKTSSKIMGSTNLWDENRRLYMDNLRLWDCLTLIRSEPNLTCQNAINLVFSLRDNDYLISFPDTHQLMQLRFPNGVLYHHNLEDAKLENIKLKDENARLHAAVWVLRDNPSLQADSTVAAIFRLDEVQFQSKFHMVTSSNAFPLSDPEGVSTTLIKHQDKLTYQNNNQVFMASLDIGSEPNMAIQLTNKPIRVGVSSTRRCRSASGRRPNSIRAPVSPMFATRKRSGSAIQQRDFSANWRPDHALETEHLFYPPGEDMNGFLYTKRPPRINREKTMSQKMYQWSAEDDFINNFHGMCENNNSHHNDDLPSQVSGEAQQTDVGSHDSQQDLESRLNKNLTPTGNEELHSPKNGFRKAKLTVLPHVTFRIGRGNHNTNTRYELTPDSDQDTREPSKSHLKAVPQNIVLDPKVSFEIASVQRFQKARKSRPHECIRGVYKCSENSEDSVTQSHLIDRPFTAKERDFKTTRIQNFHNLAQWNLRENSKRDEEAATQKSESGGMRLEDLEEISESQKNANNAAFRPHVDIRDENKKGFKKHIIGKRHSSFPVLKMATDLGSEGNSTTFSQTIDEKHLSFKSRIAKMSTDAPQITYSTEPAALRAPPWQQYPVKSYTSVKHFLDRQRRLTYGDFFLKSDKTFFTREITPSVYALGSNDYMTHKRIFNRFSPPLHGSISPSKYQHTTKETKAFKTPDSHRNQDVKSEIASLKKFSARLPMPLGHLKGCQQQSQCKKHLGLKLLHELGNFKYTRPLADMLT
ncbi:unnamed protein product [Lymnaea stagnalis]|uniref:Uncharacterized protein n=1 Tax=Lymnaea stagnalis TaxID=6523 RepID=A0AAV2I1L6_LYMST